MNADHVQWLTGYLATIGAVICLVGGLCLAGLAMLGVSQWLAYRWRKLLREVPSSYYIQNAVAMYKKQYPPGRWARDQMGWNDDAQRSSDQESAR
jgi:hypothetical protein